MQTVRLEQLIASLRPGGTSDVPDPESAFCTQNDILLHAEKPRFYVPPDLTESDDALDTEARQAFLLISAPAAVGKTTLALEILRQLAPVKRAVYVPLRKAIIGQNYFGGLISNLLPTESRADILKYLFSGELLLIFDGYDEVSMSSQQLTLNKLFANELAAALAQYEESGGVVAPAPCVIFLFRSVFGQLGIFDAILSRSRTLTVEFFSPVRRRQYLEEYLRTKDPRVTPALANEFLQGLEERLTVAVDEAEAFLGHAIVLSAFGDYLIDQQAGNAKQLANALVAGSQDEEVSTPILKAIVDVIVRREAAKFPTDTKLAALHGFAPYEAGTQEEILCEIAALLAIKPERALEDELKVPIARIAQSSLSRTPAYLAKSQEEQNSLHTLYVEELTNKMAHHPFLDVMPSGEWRFRNPVYNEYYLAKHIAHNLDVPLEPLFGARRFSFYLAFFLLSCVDGRSLRKASPTILYYLTNLVSSGVKRAEAEVDVFVEMSPAQGGWSVTVDCTDFKLRPFFLDSPLIIEIPNGGVLQNIAITSEFHESQESSDVVCIAGASGHSEKESSVTLRNAVIVAPEIELDAVRITFANVFLDTATLTLAARFNRPEGLETLTLCGADHAIDIAGPGGERWRNQFIQRRQSDADDAKAFLGKLERVLLWFRKHGRVDYGVYYKRFETVVTRKGRDPQMGRFASFLLARQVLSIDGALVVLDQKRLEGFGVHYLKQNQLGADEVRLRPLLEAWNAYTP